VSSDYAETGEQPKDILVVNAWRDVPPADRTEANFPDQFMIADTPGGRVAYLEHITDGLTVGNPAIAVEASVRFDSLRTEALRGSESLILIEQVAESWNS
jgi:hypothetical protein